VQLYQESVLVTPAKAMSHHAGQSCVRQVLLKIVQEVGDNPSIKYLEDGLRTFLVKSKLHAARSSASSPELALSIASVAGNTHDPNHVAH
jgi:hypothetical protein